MYALLPLPSVELSLKEIAYAFDTLHADGVGLVVELRQRVAGESAVPSGLRTN